MANVNIQGDDLDNVSTKIEISSLEELGNLLAAMPEGTTANVLGGDLDAGNFEVAHLETPIGSSIGILYSGPVAEGYQSPFE